MFVYLSNQLSLTSIEFLAFRVNIFDVKNILKQYTSHVECQTISQLEKQHHENPVFSKNTTPNTLKCRHNGRRILLNNRRPWNVTLTMTKPVKLLTNCPKTNNVERSSRSHVEVKVVWIFWLPRRRVPKQTHVVFPAKMTMRDRSWVELSWAELSGWVSERVSEWASEWVSEKVKKCEDEKEI